MLKIHGMTGSFNTTKIIYTATELGCDFEYVPLDFMQGEHKSPEHLKRHPLGKAPTLTVGDKSLFESGSICRYLASTVKTDLMGKNEWEHALTDQWMNFFSIHAGRWIGAYAFETVMREKFNMGTPKQEVIKEAHGYLEQQLGMVNNHLADNKHLAGDTFTIADIFAFAYVESAVAAELPIDSYKNLQTWFGALKERPCVINGKKKMAV